jgi:hypothetical protein
MASFQPISISGLRQSMRLKVVYLTLPTHKLIAYSMTHLTISRIFCLYCANTRISTYHRLLACLIAIAIKCTTPFILPRQGEWSAGY